MSRRDRRASPWSGLDRPIAVMLILLMVVGIVLSFAASPAVSSAVDPWYYLKKQMVFAGLSLVVIFVTAALSPTGVRRMAGLALAVSVLMLIGVVVIGHEVNGATRWIRIAGFSIQPSEIFKPAFVVFIAWLFAEEDRGAPVPGRLGALGLYLVGAGLLMLQPDFGQTVLISLVFGAMLWASGLAWTHTAALAGIGAAGAGAAIAIFPHIRHRLVDFVTPANDAARTQVDIAMDAIARGGLWGAGPGEGEIKHVLPEANTDFVFSVAAEEFGLVASLAIIGLYALLFARAWMLAMRLSDPFHQLATAGLALLFGLQALVNIAVNLDIAPPTGMTLPFISYGGSSMVALAFSAGLLLALTRRRPGAYAPEARPAAA
ncbi:MAG: putative peptidoglycan glycosyltransferase FtsW [Oceanicaulis sp.]